MSRSERVSLNYDARIRLHTKVPPDISPDFFPEKIDPVDFKL